MTTTANNNERKEFVNKIGFSGSFYKFLGEDIKIGNQILYPGGYENEVIEFDKLEDNYLDVYPLISAVLKKELDYIEYGGNDTICRKIKRKSTQYKNNYRIWHDYAGDYRTK